ncbi:MAG: hypothetical protein ACLR06_17345 [Christensenellaceae bacterium]
MGTMASVQSDGKEYLTPDEISVIKAYLNGIAPSADWNAVWTEATEQAPGLIIADGAALNATIAEIIASRSTWNGAEDDSFAYFKYVEILQWATNERSTIMPAAERKGRLIPGLSELIIPRMG